MLPPSQGLSHIVPPKNVDMQQHYIVPGMPLDYSAANLHIWDPMQIPTNVQNGQQSNNKKVNIYIIVYFIYLPGSFAN